MKNKAFTLIELLAVIIILGILMLIAIPSVTSYINNSRKETYVDTVKELIKGTVLKVNSGEIEINDPDTTYYVPCSCVKTENGEAKSPFGRFDPAYVVVTYDGDNYNYYFTGKDVENIGVPTITKSELLKKESIVTNIEAINTGVGIEGTSQVTIYNDDCSAVAETKPVSSTVSGDGQEQGASQLNNNTCGYQILPEDAAVNPPEKDCEYTGEFTPGITVSIGPYIYAYKKEMNHGGMSAYLESISEDGWGVFLRDKQSTDPVSEAPCTTLGGKPIVSMAYMFSSSNASSIDLTNFNTKNVIRMTGMFKEYGKNNDTVELDFKSFKTPNLVNALLMFYETGYEAQNIVIKNLSKIDFSKANIYRLFCETGYRANNIHIDARNLKVASGNTLESIFSTFGVYAGEAYVNLSGWDLSGYTSTYYMFHNFCKNCDKSKLILNDWDTSTISDFNEMFSWAMYFTEDVCLDFSTWDTSSANSLHYMFYKLGDESKNSVELNLTGWDTSNVTNMSGLFYQTGVNVGEQSGNGTLTIRGMDNWNTSKVTNMSQMFSGTGTKAATGNIGDLSRWNTSKVTNMSYMFDSAFHDSAAVDIGDISRWDTSSLTNKTDMFSYSNVNHPAIFD